MSIIIRLQNLPLLAKAGDIRQFFGDLHIPDGGVFITGGEFGYAFITFASNDDARLAMQKNGYKIMDAPVQLYLSSDSEMQQEIARVTKQSLDVSCPSRSPDGRAIIDGASYYHTESHTRERLGFSLYCGAPSPRMRSRSPLNSPVTTSATSWSRFRCLDQDAGSEVLPNVIIKSEYDKSSDCEINPEFEQNCSAASINSYDNIGNSHQIDEMILGSEVPSNITIKSEYDILSDCEINAEIQQNCFAAGINCFGNIENSHPQPVSSLRNKEASIHGSNLSSRPAYNMNVPKHFASSAHSLQHTTLKPTSNTSPMVGLSPSVRIATPPISSKEKLLSCNSSPADVLPSIKMHETPNENLFVTLSGLDREWGLRKVQNILMGIFIPDMNIKFDLNQSGSKTGTVYIKLCNTDDFKDLLSHKTYFYKYKLITVSVCPDHIFNKHFTRETPSECSLNSERGIYYYEMKGLPIDVTCQDVLDFFVGLEVIDLYIAFTRNGIGQKIFDKGTAFVAFSNKNYYQKAFSKNGQLFTGTNRNVNLRSITQKEVFECKKRNEDLLLQSKSLVPVPDGGPVPGVIEEPFCTSLAGLPKNVTTKKIFTFFIRSGARAGKIHILVDDKQQCDGRAFAEFKNASILKRACRVDGKRIGQFVISVKEISFEEMLTVLDSQKNKPLLQREAPQSQQTPGTCLNKTYKKPALRVPQEQCFRKTVVTSKSIKVENAFDSAEIEPQGTVFELLPQQPIIGDHFETLAPYGRDRNTKNATEHEARLSERDFRKGSDTFSSQSYSVFQNETRNLKKLSPRYLDKNYAKDICNVRTNYPEDISNIRTNYAENIGNVRTNYAEDIGNARTNYPEAIGSIRTNYAENIGNVTTHYAEDRQRSLSNMYHESNSSVRQTSYSSSEPYGYDGMHSDFEKAVVQIKHIDPFLAIPDLMFFLRGFDIDENNIIRIFNDHGYPTADVRVTFRNHKEAERAIRSLNGRFVNGVPIEMFLTQP